MHRDRIREGQIEEEFRDGQRGEIAVVADPDACGGETDDEMPDTIPEGRPSEPAPSSGERLSGRELVSEYEGFVLFT